MRTCAGLQLRSRYTACTSARALLPTRLEREAQQIVESASNLTRLKIVRALAETPLPASDLARVVGRPATATSQHIRVLRVLEAIARALDLLRER